MGEFLIKGPAHLNGEVVISGSKNAALPILVAALLTEEDLIVTNVPDLCDVHTMKLLLEQHGVRLSIAGTSTPDSGSQNRKVILNAKHIGSFIAPYELVRKMRASIWVLGPLLARFGYAKVSLPGGCAIGNRPVDMHIEAMRCLGAEVILEHGYIIASVDSKLRGGEIHFNKISVGATANAMMAATLAEGKSTIHNAALEPEIVDLARCLNSMGAKIQGAGTSTVTIEGVDKLNGAQHTVINDRIEAGTYAIAAAITSGDLHLIGVDYEMLASVLTTLESCGVLITKTSEGILVSSNGTIKCTKVATKPYPDFPTDMQAQLMALLAVASGTSYIEETIFENRFMHVPELNRMGAKIITKGNTAIVEGVESLCGANVMATDLRASVALILAGLSANGHTSVLRTYHLDRGYENIDQKLRLCGANVQKLSPAIQPS